MWPPCARMFRGVVVVLQEYGRVNGSAGEFNLVPMPMPHPARPSRAAGSYPASMRRLA